MSGIPSSRDFLSHFFRLQTAVSRSRFFFSTFPIRNMQCPLTLVHLLFSSLKLCPGNAKLTWESHRCSFPTLFGMYFPHCSCSLQLQIYTERTAVTKLEVLHPCVYHFRKFQESVSLLCGWDIEVLLKKVVHLGIKLTDSENKKPTSNPLQLKVLK